MTQKTATVVLVIFLTQFMNAQSKGNISVTVNDIKQTKGDLVFMLFNTEEGFPRETQKAYKKDVVAEYASSANHVFSEVPHGTYAVAVFQDENKDGEIESNIIGMPKEPVGASNLTKMGRPSFNKCSIELKQEEQKVYIRFINQLIISTNK